MAPLRDVVALKPREASQVEMGEHERSYCIFIFESTVKFPGGCTAAGGGNNGPYGAGAFETQRTCGLELSSSLW